MSIHLEFEILYSFLMIQQVAIYFRNLEEATDFYIGILSEIPSQP